MQLFQFILRKIPVLFLVTAEVVCNASADNHPSLRMRALEEQFGIKLPASAKLTNSRDNKTKERKESYLRIEIPVTEVPKFKESLTRQGSSESRRVVWEDRNSQLKIGRLPLGDAPEDIKAWWKDVKGDTLVYISSLKASNQRHRKEIGGAIVFISESTGVLFLYSFLTR